MRCGALAGRAAAGFALCAALGWVAAYFLYRIHVAAPLAAFGLSGLLAGTVARLGARMTVGCVVTFLIGNSITLLPLMTIQGMTGHEPFGQLVGFFVVSFAVAYGLSAAIGFFDPIHFCTYAWTVGAFALGGAMGGMVMAIAVTALWSYYPWGTTVVALVMPAAVGGAASGGARQDVRRGAVKTDQPALL